MTDNDIALAWQQARDAAWENPIRYRVAEQEEAADVALANDIAHWKAVAPDVRLKAEDNPEVDYRLLNQAWQAAWGNPPLVFLAVTPRKKELPKTSSWTSTLGIIAPVLAIIPVVGPILSVIASVAATASQQSKIKNYISAASTIPATAFDPQFFPQTFPVLLPLDEAQLAVAEPYYLPRLHKDFVHRIQEAQRIADQLLAGEQSVLTLSPDLAGHVVSVAPPGSKKQANWIEQLLTATGHPATPAQEYQNLQTAYGSQLPTIGNLTSPTTAGFFAQPNAQPSGNGPSVDTASIGGRGILIAAAAVALFILTRK